ncbi:MAG: DUF4845 domain-containing protein [Syntrophaceae bacterium]|nr:DUF4845 domain-containing protein [Syntrophaceae bacterium]
MLKKQNGMTAMGWILLLIFIIIIAIPSMKIIPMYINSLKITNSLNNLASDLIAQGKNSTPENIKKNLLERFEVKKISGITANEIIVTRTDIAFTVRVQHQYKERILNYRDYTLNVDESVDIPIIHNTTF